MNEEIFICLNCLSVGPLDQHLHCATCESDAVASAIGNYQPVIGAEPEEVEA